MRSLSDIYFPAIPSAPSPVYGLLFIFAYLACAFLGVYLSVTPLSFINIWLPGGLLLGALLRVPTRCWPVVAVLALLANSAFNILNHQTVVLSIEFSIGNLLAAFVAATTIRCLISYTPRINSVREVSRMVIVIVLSAMISSSWAQAALSLPTRDAASLNNWLFWWSGDALGTLLLVQMLLAPSISIRHRWHSNSWKKHLELLALFAVSGMVIVMPFGLDSFRVELGAVYLVITCMLWSTIRFDLQVTAVITTLVTVSIAISSRHDAASIPIESLRAHAVMLQMLLTASVLLGLFLSALLEERRLQAQRLREQNFFLAESQRIAQIGTWSWTPSSDSIVWSEETYRIFGVTPQAFKPTIAALISLVHPNDRDSVQEWIENCRTNGNRSVLQFRCVTPTGELRMLRGQGEWQADDGSQVARIVGTVQNITEPERTLTALRDSEHKLETVFRHLPVWISVRNLNDSTYVDINEQALHDLGYAREEIIGHSSSEVSFMSLEDRAKVQAIVSRESRFSGLEVTVRTKDGHKRRALANGERIMVGGQPCMLVVAIDISARRQMEEQLLEQSAQLKLFVECSPVALAMFDRNMCYLQVSNRWKESFGLGDADLIGQSHYSVFPDIPERWREVHRRGLQGEIIKSDEDRFVRRSGQEQWTRWEVRPWFQADGKVGGIVIFTEDVTERKQANAALIEHEKRFRTLLNNLQVGVVVQGPQAEVTWCNQMSLQLLGLTRDQLLGKTSFDKDWNIVREDGSKVLGFEQPGPQVIATGKAIRGLVLSVYRPTTESWVWLQVDAEPEFNEDGSFKQVICIFGDITARKQAEIALRESEERFRQIAAHIHEVFWVLDVTTQSVVYVSPAFEKIWGRSLEGMYGNSHEWINVIVAEDRQRVAAALEKIPTEGQYQETYRITRPDGQIRWIRDQGFAVYDSDGKLHRVVGTAQDITEAREIENQLRRSQRLESIGTLTGGIAHDFNNILAGILGFTALANQLADQSNIDRNELKAYLGHIGRAGKRAADLIAQILTFSRSDSAALSVIKMDQLTSEAVKLLRAAIPSSIEFETHVAETPAVLGNASQLHQVIMNLGTNAWHAMGHGKGRLSIILDSQFIDEAQARVLSNITPGDYVRLQVVDTGCGMSMETQERMFEPFFTTKPAGQGTGLGLSVVHGIVRSHRGAIRVTSELDRGTSFEIFLPVNVEKTAKEGDADNGTRLAPRGRGQQVLLVDDEAALVLLGEHSLKRYGYVVTGETNVRTALKRIEQNPADFDLVVTDQTMPGMTGVEFATRVHALRPTLPVLLVSGHTGSLSAAEIKKAGITEILEKPYTNEALAAAIHRQFVSWE